MVCGHCGDPLVEILAIKPTQIFAIIAVTAFIAPLLITAFAFIQDLKKPEGTKTIQRISFELKKSLSYKNFD